MKYLFLIIALLGCSANQHLKKSKKHYQKAIAKGYVPKADTVYIKDTVISDRVVTDTVFSVHDSVIYIEKDRLRVKYLRTIDSVYIEAECMEDTIYIETPVIVNEKVYIERYSNWLVLILILAAIYILRKFFK